MTKWDKLANFLISNIFVLPVVAFWYSTWNLQDKYLFPENFGLSNGLSLSFGITGLCIIGLTQSSLTKTLQNSHCIVHFVTTRVVVLFWAVLGVCHWRGLWNMLDKYTEHLIPESPEILLASGILLLGLFRSIRNIIATPFVVGFDGNRNQFFEQPMIFGRSIHCHMPFGLDVFLSISILGSLVVVFWRDVWKIVDDHVFPNNKELTILFSVAIFISIQLLAEVLQIFLRRNPDILTGHNLIIKLLIQDFYFIFVGFGNVACWRSIWKSLDIILNLIDQDIGRGCLLATSFILLVAVFSCTSLVPKGFIMDGELEKWYKFPNDFIGAARSCLKKPEKKDETIKEDPLEYSIHL